MSPEYLAQVEQAYLARAGRGLMLSARDVERVRAWARAGVPVEVVVQGIEAAFEQPPEKVFGLAYAAPAVEQAIKGWQERGVGRHPEAEAQPELHAAFDALLARLAEAGRGQPAEPLRVVLRSAWRAVRDLRDRSVAGAERDPVEALEAVAERMYDDAWSALAADVRAGIEFEIEAALATERRMGRPEMVAVTRQAVLRRRVREAAGLPALRLGLSRGW